MNDTFSSDALSAAPARVGVDTGGTFTDVIAVRAGRLSSHKLPSTPQAFASAVVEGARAVSGNAAFDLMHSTTVATNALLEGKGAKTALVTTAGFRDALEIGRQNRPHLYDWMPRRVPPLVPRSLRFELPERVAADGSVIVPPDLSPLPEIICAMKCADVVSVAVVFLFSFLRPEHEARVGEALEAAGFSVSLSHRVLPEFREYERMSTTVVNAYVCPAMTGYLRRLAPLAREAGARGLRVVQSNGGCLTPERASAEAVHTLLSGPAAGILGACRVAREPNLITFDMGGTSTDVALVRGEPVVSTELTLGGFPVGVPMVDVHTVGAGGGSIAAVDPGGALTVGPESAGARPGPACYGASDLPTVTDAHLVLGHLRPETFLDGRMTLHTERAHRALEALGRAAGGRTPGEIARDILRVVNANMEAAIREISVMRGHDPTEFTLVGFGGAGGLHVFDLAESLNMRRVLVPCHPGVLSALGAVATPLVHETSRTVMTAWTSETPAALQAVFAGLKADLAGRFRADGETEAEPRWEARVDARYLGQSHELSIPVQPEALGNLPEHFHEAHRRRYGHADPSEPLEMVTLRLRGVLPPPELNLPPLPERKPGDPDPGIAPGLVRREHLRAGDTVEGPALVVEAYATLRVPGGWAVKPDAIGNLVGSRQDSIRNARCRCRSGAGRR